jgi:hypothetical protein
MIILEEEMNGAEVLCNGGAESEKSFHGDTLLLFSLILNVQAYIMAIGSK